MNVGLYFGSFNPIHIGHLIIATSVLNTTELDEVWFVVSPQNPLKKSGNLLNEQHRLSLVQLAIEGEKGLRASNVEFRLPKPSYTIDTLTYLSEQHPNKNFYVIMGSDSLQNIDNWKNGYQIKYNYNIIVYQRPGFIVESNTSSISVVNAPLLDISATLIRRNIREGKSIRYLVTDEVLREIKAKNYYGSASENPAD